MEKFLKHILALGAELYNTETKHQYQETYEEAKVLYNEHLKQLKENEAIIKSDS